MLFIYSGLPRKSRQAVDSISFFILFFQLTPLAIFCQEAVCGKAVWADFVPGAGFEPEHLAYDARGLTKKALPAVLF